MPPIAFTVLATGARAGARRLLLSLFGAGIVLLGSAAAAAAAEGDGELGGAMSWIKLEDSHGLSIWQYNLNLHRGSAMDPWKFVWSIVVEIPWQIFRLLVALTAWLLRFTLEFSWLKVVTAPFTALASAVSGVIDDIGIGGTLLTVAAFVCVLWMARGMWALGVSELVISLVVAAAATSMLANPMERVIGTDGAIYQARDLGLEVAVDLTNDDPTATENPVPAQMSALLVDTFVRQPHQLVNYGTSFEGGSCEEVYNEAVAMEPLPPDSRDPREHVRSCDEGAYHRADNPDPSQIMVMAALYPAGLLILLLVLAISVSLFVAVVLALAQGLKAIVSLVAGVLPGRARGMLLRNIADLIIALALVAFASIFASGFMTMIQTVFSSTGAYSWNLMMTLYLVDLLLIVGIIAVWRYHKAFRRAGERLAEALASARPGKATTLPDRSSAARDIAKIGATVWGWRQVRQMTRQQQATPDQTKPQRPQGPQDAPRPSPSGSATGGRPPAGQRPAAGELTASAERRAIPAGAGPSPRPELGPGSGPAGSIPMPTAGGTVAKGLTGAAAKAVASSATGGVSNVLVAGARVAGKTVGAATRGARRVLSSSGQERRAQLLQRLVRDTGGAVPTPSSLPRASQPVQLPPRPAPSPQPQRHFTERASTHASAVRPQAGRSPTPSANSGPTAASQPSPSTARTRKLRRVILPDGQVVFIPAPGTTARDRS